MAKGNAPSLQDHDTLRMALIGYQMEKEKIDQKIREIEGKLGRRRGTANASAAAAPAKKKAAAPRKRRELSAAARARIAAAQRRRWAEHRKKLAQAAKAES